MIPSITQAFLYGVVGFLGSEALRIHGVIWKGESLAPQRQTFLYALILLVLAIFSGILAELLASDKPPLAVFIGFSVPSNIQALMTRVAKGSGMVVDDIGPPGNQGIQTLTRFLRSYFS